MSIRSEITAVREQWRQLTVYEKFEHAVILILTALIAVMVAAAVLNLAWEIFYALIVVGPFDPGENALFQALFGMILTVIIALEFKRSVLGVAERPDSIVQVRTVVLLAMLAVLRKIIILDLSVTDASKVFGLSAAILALGAVYWFVRDWDRKRDISAGDSVPPGTPLHQPHSSSSTT